VSNGKVVQLGVEANNLDNRIAAGLNEHSYNVRKRYHARDSRYRDA
jgi:hypothetical protein